MSLPYRIIRHVESDGFVWYEFGSLMSFTIIDLVNDIFNILGYDLRSLLFNPAQIQ